MGKKDKGWLSNIFGSKKEQVSATSNQQATQSISDDEFFKPGDVIGGKFEIHRVLGKGGFGVVYLVYQKELQELSALKTFRDEYLQDAAAREAFKREALVWVNLDEHRFILAARWVEEYVGRLFVEMEYIAPDERGRASLHDHLFHSNGPLDTNNTLLWAIQFCCAMEHANAQGIKAHRDIKPANIMVTRDGTLKLTDFGLAFAAQSAWLGKSSSVGRQVEGSLGLSLINTEGCKVCGTPGYIPPEVYRGDGADVRSDIYSFGLVLWQMASGSGMPPFVPRYSGDIDKYMQEIYQRQINEWPPRVDSPLQPAIERCLNPDTSERFSSFEQLRCELEPIYLRLTGTSFKILGTGKQSATFWSNKGASLATLGRYEEAISCYDKALDIDPRDTVIWNNKGHILNSLGRVEEAIRFYDKALEIDPRNTNAWINKGNILNSLGRSEEAIRCYDKALEIDPRDANAWSNKGNSLKDLGRTEEAIDCYDKALEIDSRHVNALNNKGNSLSNLGRSEEAIRCYDKALEIDPRDTATWYNKGNSLNSLGRVEEAIRCYDKALEIDPRDTATWYNKAVSQESIKDWHAATDSWRKYLDVARTDPTQKQYIPKVKSHLKKLESK